MKLFRSRKSYSTVKVRKKDIPNGLWTKCPSCTEIVFKQELDAGCNVCPKCNYHFPLGRKERLAMLIEEGSFQEWDADLYSVDTLEFTGTASYISKLKENVEKTGENDAIVCGKAVMGKRPVAIGVMDFSFLGASMGSVVGEKVSRLLEHATEQRLPAIIVCASGGARMYEGMLSLMQMAKTSAALSRHAAAKMPYLTLLTNPTTAGVMASYATLGDVIIAEPNALIGFAGPRVIRETTQQELPEGFQKSEFLLKHGLLDMVVHRRELKATTVRVLDFLTARCCPPAAAS